MSDENEIKIGPWVKPETRDSGVPVVIDRLTLYTILNDGWEKATDDEIHRYQRYWDWKHGTLDSPITVEEAVAWLSLPATVF